MSISRSRLYILILFSSFFSTKTLAQNEGIRFFEGTWNEALTTAQKNHQTIFILISTKTCFSCSTLDSVIRTKEVGDYYNQNFLNYRLDAEEPVGITFCDKYVVDAFPSFIFMNEKGEIFYRNYGIKSANLLIEEAKRALKIAKTDKPLSVLTAEYQAGKRDSRFLREYLIKATENGGEHSALLDEYLATIPESEYYTEKVLALIADCGTTIHSKAFELLMRANKRQQKLTVQQNRYLMKGIVKAERKAIQKAVDTRDEQLLERTIEIAHLTAFNPKNAFAEERLIRMKYAKATQNFEAYQKLAQPLAKELMAKTPEQLENETQDGIDLSTKNFVAQGKDTTSMPYKAMIYALQNGAAFATAFQLNSIAEVYAEFSMTNEPLAEALLWSKRAIELRKTPDYLETYADLLFKLGKKRDAIKAQKEAIAFAKETGLEVEEMEITLKKMKND